MLRLYVRCFSLKEKILARLRAVLGDETGATVAEYALVLVLVTVAVITVLSDLGTALKDKIEVIVSQLRGATPGP